MYLLFFPQSPAAQFRQKPTFIDYREKRALSAPIFLPYLFFLLSPFFFFLSFFFLLSAKKTEPSAKTQWHEKVLRVYVLNMGKVEPYSCWDGVVNGTAGDEELENILSILDFPLESLEGDEFVGDWDASKSQYLGPIPSDVLIRPPTIDTGPPVLLPRPVAPIDATPEPKQLSYRFEDTSGSFILRQNKCTEVQEQSVFQTQSPVSVLESNGSSSAGKSSLIKSHVGKRARSKRARPSGLSVWLLMSPLFATSSAYRKTCNARKNKERRKKLSQLSVAMQTIEDSSDKAKNPFQASDYVELHNAASQRPAVTKKCTHCEVTKTPQWREGPMGPKTLCNACGVRYRSGRLYPEYRPAASPTFVPSLHSNSHKKVIEMRTKAKQQATKIEEPSMSPQLEFIPMSSYWFDPIC
ncbi:hypothetical protein Pfo_018087 [Paulownia fortunei]|nr:hypothetical protein Pfo_018087 [Paulownia fortunei]